MRLFGSLYQKILRLARHSHAERYLVGISFLESWIFPLPTALMVAPMMLAARARIWKLAMIATLSSVGGGLFGYLIGYWFFTEIGQPIVEFYGATAKFQKMQNEFAEYGVWIVLLAGVTPIPYKILTVASGVLKLPLLEFTIASLIGRAMQFYLIGAVLWCGGEKLHQSFEKWSEIIGWGIVVLIIIAYLVWR